jgi:hypothetical protein
MIKTIKNILTSAILHERMLCEFKGVFNKKPKEKTYSVKLTQGNIELLTACYKYGIKNETELCQTIRQQRLTGSADATPKSCEECRFNEGDDCEYVDVCYDYDSWEPPA